MERGDNTSLERAKATNTRLASFPFHIARLCIIFYSFKQIFIYLVVSLPLSLKIQILSKLWLFSTTHPLEKKHNTKHVSIIYLDALGLSCDARSSPWPGIMDLLHWECGLSHWTTSPTTPVLTGDFNLGESSRWSSCLASPFGHCKASVIFVFNSLWLPTTSFSVSLNTLQKPNSEKVFIAGAIRRVLNCPSFTLCPHLYAELLPWLLITTSWHLTLHFTFTLMKSSSHFWGLDMGSL